MFMRGNMTRFLVAPAIALAMLIGIACAPAADPTATTAPAATAAPAATKAPAATAAPVKRKFDQ